MKIRLSLIDSFEFSDEGELISTTNLLQLGGDDRFADPEGLGIDPETHELYVAIDDELSSPNFNTDEIDDHIPVLQPSDFVQEDILSEIPADTKVENCSYQIVNTYPHDENAFTQGLVYYDGDLYEGTGLNGRSSLRRVDLETGKILQNIDLDNKYFGEGITLFEDQLVQLTWLSKTGFVYDRESFEKLQEFTYPTEGWGLTHDGDNLIMSDGSNSLFFLDPETFEEVKRISVSDQNEPIENLNELEYINGEIYANVWMSDDIARISPTTGQVLGWIDLSGLRNPSLAINQDAVLNGIAYNPEDDRLFVTGKLWPDLFEITIDCDH